MNKEELQSLLEGVRTALTGNQSKLDKNQNNKIDREDFTLLRSKKKPMAENADLLALLEHLYGVLLHEKAARLKEAQYDGGQTSDPTNFYQRNREDNDRIRMSIVRKSAEEKKKEEEEKKRLGGAQMENAEYDSILEKIYNLLAEEAPLPTAEAPPIKGGVLPWIPPYGLPTVPMAPQPPVPPFPPRLPRPPVPPCDGTSDCWYKWTDTLHWEWDIYQRKWVLRGLGDDGTGGYWRPVQMPEGFQWQGGPYQGPSTFELFLRGLGILRGNNHTISGLD